MFRLYLLKKSLLYRLNDETDGAVGPRRFTLKVYHPGVTWAGEYLVHHPSHYFRRHFLKSTLGEYAWHQLYFRWILITLNTVFWTHDGAQKERTNNGTFVRYDSIHTVASEQGDGVNEPFWVTRTFALFVPLVYCNIISRTVCVLLRGA